MAHEGKLENALPFFRIIEKYVICSIACSYSIHDLERAKRRIFVPNTFIDWDFLNNPYLVAFRMLMDMFHVHRAKAEPVIPMDQKVDFYFDDQTEKKKIITAWDGYIKERPLETRNYFGNAPRFENDMEYLPLQASDLWAWWVRKWVIEGRPEKMDQPNFGPWKSERSKHPKIHISFTEDQVVGNIIKIMRPMLRSEVVIYDIKFSFLI